LFKQEKDLEKLKICIMVAEIKEIRFRKTLSARGLNRILNNSNKNDLWVLREITGLNEKQKLIKLRHEHYQERGVTEHQSKEDPFDDYARFFVLIGKEGNKEYVSKSLRAINKENPLGKLPLELNTMNSRQLNEFNPKSSWTESTLDFRERENIANLLNKYQPLDKIYELGGLCGIDPSLISPLVLMLGVIQVGYEEGWNLVFHTQHPRHIRGYETIGLPYKRVGGSNFQSGNGEGYLDYCERPAITLALERDEFRKVYEKTFKEATKKILRIEK